MSAAFDKACQSEAKESISRRVNGVDLRQVALVMPRKNTDGAPLPLGGFRDPTGKEFLKSDRLYIHEGGENTFARDLNDIGCLIFYSGPIPNVFSDSYPGFGRFSLLVKERASGIVLAERIDFFLGKPHMNSFEKTCLSGAEHARRQREFIGFPIDQRLRSGLAPGCASEGD